MDTKFSLGFARKNLHANKIFVIPFIISSSIMMALFSIMCTLCTNEYVNTAHDNLPYFIRFGAVVIAIFTLVFMVYANKYLVKRRYSEFALYLVLGLEEKHIKKIIFSEFLFIFISVFLISQTGGYIGGKLMFILADRLTNANETSLQNYGFSIFSLAISFLYLLLVFLILFFINNKNINTVTPVSLISSSKKAEKEPSSNRVLAFLGVILLFAGYFIALTITGTAQSIEMFFLAAFIVIVATYLLFVSFSIYILKKMKKKREFFYRPENFLSVSQMLYRMKSNSMGLASIALLCASVVITISVTYTIYVNMDNILNTTFKKEYLLFENNNISLKSSEDQRKTEKERIRKIIESQGDVKNYSSTEYIYFFAKKEKNKFVRYEGQREDNNKECLVILSKLSDYNRDTNQNIKLAKDEALIYSNTVYRRNIKNINLADMNIKTIEKKMDISTNIVTETYKIVVPDEKIFINIGKYYREKYKDERSYIPNGIQIVSSWDSSNNSREYDYSLENISKQEDIKIISRHQMEDMLNEVNGGFLFLGIVIGLIFITGTVLITYYKHISEGYEDRKNFQIMKKVGLSDEMIDRTSKKQIIWMFFVPVFVALLHSLVSSKIIFNFLQLFGVQRYMDYGKNIFIIIFIFSIFYYTVFKITSDIYCRIVR